MSDKQPQRYWEDVNEGGDVPSITIPITETRLYQQVSGSQDFYPVHHDREFARSGGHPDVFVNTGFMQSCFNHLLCDYAGDDGWLRKFRMEMRRMNRPGDIMTFKGRVVRKYVNDQGEKCVDLDVWCENQHEGVTTPSAATVLLPSRGG